MDSVTAVRMGMGLVGVPSSIFSTCGLIHAAASGSFAAGLACPLVLLFFVLVLRMGHCKGQ